MTPETEIPEDECCCSLNPGECPIHEPNEPDWTDEEIDLQYLIDTGLAWRLEGAIGRAAMAAIEAGECVLGPEGRYDFWGNYVPSRTEVEPGTKGSVEYAEARGWGAE